MNPRLWPIEDLLPHARPMILIDEVVGRVDGRFVTALTVRAGAPFVEAGRGAPAHVAIEWMAQTCGANAGVEALESGGPVRLGLLLGTRDFRCSIPWFAVGERLKVSVAPVFRDAEIGSFDCVVTRAGAREELAHAQLTVYQPEDAAALLASQGKKVSR
jgi:predicted hotdog family 3-hydroxylacyl-ACP dehydratase